MAARTQLERERKLLGGAELLDQARRRADRESCVHLDLLRHGRPAAAAPRGHAAPPRRERPVAVAAQLPQETRPARGRGRRRPDAADRDLRAPDRVPRRAQARAGGDAAHAASAACASATATARPMCPRTRSRSSRARARSTRSRSSRSSSSSATTTLLDVLERRLHDAGARDGGGEVEARACARQRAPRVADPPPRDARAARAPALPDPHAVRGDRSQRPGRAPGHRSRGRSRHARRDRAGSAPCCAPHGEMLAPEWSEPLRDELKWLARRARPAARRRCLPRVPARRDRPGSDAAPTGSRARRGRPRAAHARAVRHCAASATRGLLQAARPEARAPHVRSRGRGALRLAGRASRGRGVQEAAQGGAADRRGLVRRRGARAPHPGQARALRGRARRDRGRQARPAFPRSTPSASRTSSASTRTQSSPRSTCAQLAERGGHEAALRRRAARGAAAHAPQRAARRARQAPGRELDRRRRGKPGADRPRGRRRRRPRRARCCSSTARVRRLVAPEGQVRAGRERRGVRAPRGRGGDGARCELGRELGSTRTPTGEEARRWSATG